MSRMETSFYDQLYRKEKNHWWFSCRRRLAVAMLRRFGAKTPGRILDMGCGTGATLDELRPLGTVFGLDISATALHYCMSRNHTRLTLGVGESLPYRESTFDGVVSLDVIEHIEQDAVALQNLYRICAPHGLIVITVPATPWLWTTRDDRLLHKRRYTSTELISKARAAGFEVVKCSYYCVFFFPIVAAVVLFNRMFGRKADVKDDVPSVNPVLNVLFCIVLSLEQRLMCRLDYPFGVSLFCVLRKPASASNT